MRRTSIITTLFLLLVIIGLVVALVVTNIPEKQEVTDPNDGQVVGEENVGEEKEEPETPTNVALDSEVVKQAYKILQLTSDAYYMKGTNEATREDLEDKNIIKAAYMMGAKDMVQETDFMFKNEYRVSGKIPAEEFDKIIKQIYGDVEYEHTGFGSIIATIATYVAEEDMYYICAGYGGGGYFSYDVKGIVKAEEYSDRYEITEKYLYIESHDGGNGSNFEIRAWHSGLSKSLGRFSENSLEVGLPQLNELLADVTIKEIYTGDPTTDSQAEKYYIETYKKILSKYYDDATEYKHTFMKNENGTFYWYKSEIIK